MHGSIAPVLLVHQTHTKSAPLLDHLTSQKIPIIETHQLTEANRASAIKHCSMILCDWELFQAQQDDPNYLNSVNGLFDSSLPVVFFSSLQSASVKFRQVNSRSVYSMKTCDSARIFDAICELAKQVENAPEDRQLNLSTRESAPHFFQSLVLDAASSNSCVHGLF